MALATQPCFSKGREARVALETQPLRSNPLAKAGGWAQLRSPLGRSSPDYARAQLRTPLGRSSPDYARASQTEEDTKLLSIVKKLLR